MPPRNRTRVLAVALAAAVLVALLLAALLRGRTGRRAPPLSPPRPRERRRARVRRPHAPPHHNRPLRPCRIERRHPGGELRGPRRLARDAGRASRRRAHLLARRRGRLGPRRRRTARSASTRRRRGAGCSPPSPRPAFLPFAPEWGYSPVQLDARAGLHVRGLVVHLVPATELVGHVVDAERRPVAGRGGPAARRRGRGDPRLNPRPLHLRRAR